MEADIPQTLQKLGAGLSESSLRQLGYLFCVFDLKHGELVCEAGRPSQSLYVLHHGILRVSVKRGPTEIHVPSMKRGDWVGEVCLLDPGPATATVSVAGQAVVLEFTHQSLREFMQRDPAGASCLITTLTRDLAQRLHRTSDSLIKYDRSTALLTEPPPEPAPDEITGLFTRLLGVHKHPRA